METSRDGRTKPVAISIGPGLLARLDAWVEAQNIGEEDRVDHLNRSSAIRKAIETMISDGPSAG